MINKVLAKDILEIARLDQRARKSGHGIEETDRKNLIRIKRIVREFDWPTVSLVGRRASHMAWLIVQHADADIEFQKKCLRLMAKAARTGEVALQNVAYLTDRVLVNQRKPQIYGTQFYKDHAGKWVPRSIKNTANLEGIRKQARLENFKSYQRKISKLD